jgi:hypothetical protein
MKNVVKCSKDFFAYFNALETYGILCLLPSAMLLQRNEMLKYSSQVQVYLFQKLATSGEHVVYKNCSECQNKNKKEFMYTSCSPDVLSL